MDSKAESRRLPATSVAPGGEESRPEARPRLAVRGGGPLYLQVANALKEEIVDGTFPVGSLLPTEEALCKRFSVSRYTVREALKRLRDDGLVASRQGAGTVVVPPSTTDSDLHQVMSINDLATFGNTTRFVIESMRMAPIDRRLATRTGLPAGEEWLEVIGYRLTDGTDVPICCVEYYINRAYAGVGRLLQRHTGPIFSLIEDLYGQSIVEVQQHISAALVSPALATELKIDPVAAVLEVRRAYRTAGGTTAQVTINTHPASFQHSMTMRRLQTQHSR